MPSLGKRKKKQEARSSDATTVMATGGRYIVKVRDSHHSTSRYQSKAPPTVVRHATTKRKSDAGKNNRSLSVPSLTSVDINGTTRQSSPPQQSRSNSVRLPGGAAKKFSFKKKIAKIFGSHSDLSGKCSVISDELASGVYRPIGEFRTRSTGGSSDCSTSSLTSAPAQNSELSRHNSLRDSSRSRVSQSSVFSSRQASYDSADINFTVHGTIVPSESGLRPRSIAVMHRSGSSNSLKNNTLHTITDLKYHSIAAVPPRLDGTIYIDPSHTHVLDSRGRGGIIIRGNPSDDLESPLEESEKVKIKPSDPEYKKVAQNLMSCLPPDEQIYEANRKTSNEGLGEDYIATYMYGPPSPMKNSTIDEGLVNHKYRSGPVGVPSYMLPRGWDIAHTSTGLKYYVDHTTQSTHWKLPNDSDDALSLPNGWEVVKSNQYGTYYVNHNNKTAQYQHPIFSRPPPPYYNEEEDGFRRAPIRSHSHRSSQAHRIVDGNTSLPRRSKSFRNEAMTDLPPDTPTETDDILHTRQLSTMTYVPPSPFQIAEIPSWLKDYVTASDNQIDWLRYTPSELAGLDTMIKRLLKKHSEQLVKKFEYYRVGLQQEIDERQKVETLRRSSHQQDVHNHHSSHSPRTHKHTTRTSYTNTYNGMLTHHHHHAQPHLKSGQSNNHKHSTPSATLPHGNPSTYHGHQSNFPFVSPEMLQGLEEAFV